MVFVHECQNIVLLGVSIRYINQENLCVQYSTTYLSIQDKFCYLFDALRLDVAQNAKMDKSTLITIIITDKFILMH